MRTRFENSVIVVGLTAAGMLAVSGCGGEDEPVPVATVTETVTARPLVTVTVMPPESPSSTPTMEPIALTEQQARVAIAGRSTCKLVGVTISDTLQSPDDTVYDDRDNLRVTVETTLKPAGAEALAEFADSETVLTDADFDGMTVGANPTIPGENSQYVNVSVLGDESRYRAVDQGMTSFNIDTLASLPQGTVIGVNAVGYALTKVVVNNRPEVELAVGTDDCGSLEKVSDGNWVVGPSQQPDQVVESTGEYWRFDDNLIPVTAS